MKVTITDSKPWTCDFCGGHEEKIKSEVGYFYRCKKCGFIHGTLRQDSKYKQDWRDRNLIKKSPCQKECPHRVVGCHSWCDYYQRYAAYKEYEREEHLKEIEVNSYVDVEILKNKKKSNRRGY